MTFKIIAQHAEIEELGKTCQNVSENILINFAEQICFLFLKVGFAFDRDFFQRHETSID